MARILIIAVLACLGCSSATPATKLEPGVPAVCVAGACGDPLRVDFGSLEVGADGERVVQVRNVAESGGPVALRSVEVLGADATAFSVAALLGDIQPRETRDIVVRFHPRARGSAAAQLSIATDSAARPSFTVALSGVGTTRDLDCLASAPIDLGQVGSGCVVERDFAVTNRCPFPVHVSASLAPGAEALSIVSRPVWPARVAPDGSVSMTLSWQPSAIGPMSTELVLDIAELTRAVSIPIAGTRVLGAERVDSFFEERRRADLLFVIDDSSSMASKRASLERNLREVADWLRSWGTAIDWRVAVTTTSVCDGYPDCAAGQENLANGRILPLDGGLRVVSPATPNLAAVLASSFAVGSAGSDVEQPLRAASLAVSPSLLAGHNQGFLRDGVPLLIFVITDGLDEDATPVSEYVNAFLSLKPGRPYEVTFSAISPTLPNEPAGCSYDPPSAGASTRLREVVNATGGLRDEICAPDWSKMFESFFGTPCWPRTRYPLSAAPDLSVRPEALRVAVDGVAAAPFGPMGDQRWRYNSVMNSVDFEPLAVPEHGSTVTITYNVLACGD